MPRATSAFIRCWKNFLFSMYSSFVISTSRFATNFDKVLTPGQRAQAKLAVKDEYTANPQRLLRIHCRLSAWNSTNARRRLSTDSYSKHRKGTFEPRWSVSSIRGHLWEVDETSSSAGELSDPCSRSAGWERRHCQERAAGMSWAKDRASAPWPQTNRTRFFVLLPVSTTTTGRVACKGGRGFYNNLKVTKSS